MLKILRLGREGIDARMQGEGVATGHPLDAAAAERGGADRLDEAGRAVERRPRLVPLQQHELDVVLAPPLARAKGLRKLVDRPRGLRHQPLHERLGAGLQKPWLGFAVKTHRDRVDVRLGQHLAGEDRGVDLEKPPAVEHAAEIATHPGAEFEDGPCRHA